MTENAPFVGGPLEPEARLGKNFIIEEEIATGGSAWVYAAHDKNTGEPLALKLFKEAYDERRIEAFQDEGRRHFALRHPNVTRLLWLDQHKQQFFEKNGRKRTEYTLIRPYSVMERAANSMGALMRTAVLPVNAAVRYVTEAAEGLQYAHEEHGLIHRDIKPDNILVAHQGHAQITDFGISIRRHGVAAETTTVTSHDIAGTFPYMAPEQFRDDTQFHPSTDIYALGATLYESLCNRRPFFIENGNWVSYYEMHSSVEPAPIQRMTGSAVNKVVEALQEPIFKALAKDPRNRYQTMDEFVDAIRTAAAKGQEKNVTSYLLAPPRPQALALGETPLHIKPATQQVPESPNQPPVGKKQISRRRLFGMAAGVASAAAVGYFGLEDSGAHRAQESAAAARHKAALGTIATRFVTHAQRTFGTGYGFELAHSLLDFDSNTALAVAKSYDAVFSEKSNTALATELASRLVTKNPDKARAVMRQWSDKQKVPQAIMVAAGFASEGDLAPARELLQVTSIRFLAPEAAVLRTIIANTEPNKALETYTNADTHWAVTVLSRAYARRYPALFRDSAEAYRRKTINAYDNGITDTYRSQLLDLSPTQPDFLATQLGYRTGNIPSEAIVAELASRRPEAIVTYVGPDKPDDTYRRLLAAALGQRKRAFVDTLLAQEMPLYAPDPTHQENTETYNPPFAIINAWLKVSCDPTNTKNVDAAFDLTLAARNADHLGNYGAPVMAALLRS